MKVREIEIPDNRPFIVRASEYKPADNFNPPNTLGKPRGESVEAKRVMAMDACIKNVLSGFQSELYNAGTPMFAGYGLLSSISQEALIRAGVETIADEMTRKFVKFRYDVDDGRENHEQEISALEEEAAKFKLKEIFNDAAQKDGYFGGCLVYIDVGELDDEEALEPLVLDKKTFKKGMLKGFKVIEPINIYPGEYNTNDPTDEHYFNPEYWYVLGKRYHASRFLYFVSNSVPVLLKPAYNFFGIARAQLALDYIAHFVENRESAQELLNKFSLTCWKTDMSQVLAGESCNDLVKRVRMFNKMKSNNGTLVVDKEQEDIMQINTPLAGVRDIVDMSLSLLTAVWRIPKIKYIGEGEGGLNASSKEQMRSFYDFILSQKEKMFTGPMETVLKILQLNMGKDINESIGFEFPSLVEMDDAEIASLNKLKADTAVQLINAGVVSQEEVRQNLSMDKHSGFSMIDVDDTPEQPEQPNEKEIVKVEDEDLAYDSFEGHAGRIGQVGGSLPKEKSNIEIFKKNKKYLDELLKDIKKNGYSGEKSNKLSQLRKENDELFSKIVNDKSSKISQKIENYNIENIKNRINEIVSFDEETKKIKDGFKKEHDDLWEKYINNKIDGYKWEEEDNKIFEKREEFNKKRFFEKCEKISNILKGDKKSGVKLDITSNKEEQYNLLNTVYSDFVGENILPENFSVSINNIEDGGRSHAGENSITITKYSNNETPIHEFAHIIESVNDDILTNSLAFAMYRTKGEESIEISKLKGEEGAYRADEVSKQDKWFNPYCGKVYFKKNDSENYDNCYASEVLSMGIEQIYKDPVKFLSEDEEYFKFVIANIRGEL